VREKQNMSYTSGLTSD